MWQILAYSLSVAWNLSKCRRRPQKTAVTKEKLNVSGAFDVRPRDSAAFARTAVIVITGKNKIPALAEFHVLFCRMFELQKFVKMICLLIRRRAAPLCRPTP